MNENSSIQDDAPEPIEPYLPRYTQEEYLALSPAWRPFRVEYIQGLLHVMLGPDYEPSEVALNFRALLSERLSEKETILFGDNARIFVPSVELFAYPEIVVCEAIERFDSLTITNPTGIVEVLSPTTERYDRTVKLPAYLSLPSVRAVALVRQDKPCVEIYSTEGSIEIVENEGEFIFLGCKINLADLYKKV